MTAAWFRRRLPSRHERSTARIIGTVYPVTCAISSSVSPARRAIATFSGLARLGFFAHRRRQPRQPKLATVRARRERSGDLDRGNARIGAAFLDAAGDLVVELVAAAIAAVADIPRRHRLSILSARAILAAADDHSSCGWDRTANQRITGCAGLYRAQTIRPMYYQDHMDGINWVAMGVAMVFLLIVVVLVLWAITGWPRMAGHSEPQSIEAGTTSARDLLDERMVRGEIDVDEYQQRRNALDQQTR